MATRPVEAAACGTKLYGTAGGARSGRDLRGHFGRRWDEGRVVHETAGEGRVHPVDAERRAQGARLLGEAAVGEAQDRDRGLGRRREMAVAGQQNATIGGA